ncbi:MAG: chorismate-binding protein [Desulfuromonadales bacterium]|nr:chorismate-binding protein [Desulfuromonadales bacterium]
MIRQRQTEPHQPDVLLESFGGGANSRSYRFSGCESVITAHSPEQVVPALAEVEQAVALGKHAAGYVAYEAASGLNPDLPVSGKDSLPLVWFGIFSERLDCTGQTTSGSSGDCLVSPPELAIDEAAYRSAVGAIREAIARGETYQVNFTTRQRFRITGDPFVLYRRMCRNQRAPFCAWLDIGTHRILSASPELFFSLDDDLLTMRPMKGTAARLPRADDDRRQRELLTASAKERAENLMIVDLVRNDLSTIAETGSVKVLSLFDVETFPTVHQLTSTVTARVRPEVGLTGIFRALFPCGSVTGAPKQRTMEIIKGLETSPRRVYCGAIGYVSPQNNKNLPPFQGEGRGGDGVDCTTSMACQNKPHPPPNLPLERGGMKDTNFGHLSGIEAVFSVAIRTAVVETATGNAELGIGSGITWDSDAGSEYRECLAKSAFLTRSADQFSLIESLRYDEQGYLLLERHLRRMASSAAYFGFAFDGKSLRGRLMDAGEPLIGPHKVRVLLAEDGNISIDSQTLQQHAPAAPCLVTVSRKRMNSDDPFLYHKTTRRELYDRELREHPDCYDVIFLNERGELTEGCFNSLVVAKAGELLTPALECGLLPGVLREELLEVGAMREALLTLEDLLTADTVWMVNSVRGWRECIINPPLCKGGS